MGDFQRQERSTQLQAGNEEDTRYGLSTLPQRRLIVQLTGVFGYGLLIGVEERDMRHSSTTYALYSESEPCSLRGAIHIEAR